MRDLTVQDVLRLLRERVLVLLFIPAAAVLCTVLAFSLLPREYEAAASLFVMVRYEDVIGSQRYDINAGSGLASDYGALFERANVLAAVEREMGVTGLSGKVRLTVKVASGTRVVDIIAAGSDPVLCAEVATEASRIFRDYIQEFLHADIHIVREADVPTAPLPRPLLRSACIAGLAALGICAFIVLAQGVLSTRIQSDGQIEKDLGLPVLGRLPDYRAALAGLLAPSAENTKPLFTALPEMVGEAVKALAVNLRFAWEKRPVQSLLITSTLPGEGKSSVAVLLASALAEEGARVLLMDMNMRSPATCGLLQRRGKYDLTDYLAGRADTNDIITPSGVDHLFFVDSCRSASLLPRVLQSDRFAQFYAAARAQFDYILLDTPALSRYVDASMLATIADGALLVIADGQVELKDAQAALMQLKRGGAPVLGAAVNYKGGVRG